MYKKYYKTFKFYDTEAAARAFCARYNQTERIARKRPAHYTPWKSSDGKENKFIAWYEYTNR